MPRYLIAKDAICQDPTCNSKVTARGYCRRHYMLEIRNKAYTCLVQGCKTRARSKAAGYCLKHLTKPAALPQEILHRYETVIANLSIENYELRTRLNTCQCTSQAAQ